MPGKQTVVVTGASQGIGAAVVQAFLDRGYNVVANALRSFSNNGSVSAPNSRPRRGGHRSGSDS